MSIIERQYGYIVDLLSSGEIEGLVGGLSGIYLNGTSLLNKSTYKKVRGKAGVATVIGNQVTDANGLFNNVSPSDGDRYLQIYNAGSATTTAATINRNDYTVTVSSSNFFQSKHLLNYTGTDGIRATDFLKFLVRIEGAGVDGSDYIGVAIGLNGSNGDSVDVYPSIETTVSAGAIVRMDEIFKISSIADDNTCTLAGSVATNVSQANCRLSPAVQYSSSNASNLTYDDTYGFVQTGTRYQKPLASFSGGRGAPSASVIIGSNISLTRSSVGNAGGSQGPQIISGNQFNFTQYSYTEIDAVKVAIEFPAGMRHNGREGESRFTYVEFQIIVNYTTDTGGTPTTQSRLIYGKDYGGSSFDANIPAWPTIGVEGDSYLINYAHNNYSYSGSRYSSGVVSKKGANSAFIKEYYINLEPFKPFRDWSIEIRRISPEALGEYCPEDNTFVAVANVKNIQAYIFDKFSYPLTAYGAVSFSAEDFQSVPSRAYHLRGMKIKVPTNYFPRDEINSVSAQYTRQKGTGIDTGTYQTWDGTLRGDETLSRSDINFPKVYSNNPAWVFYDILTNKEYGLGEYIDKDDIDIYSLYQIGRYCDELVDNGKGATEPRFSCNVYLQKQEEAYKVLKDLSSTFRGMMFWLDGAITAVQDRPREPIYTFNSSNVRDGMFNYTYTGSKSRINQVSVRWNNPDEFYKQTILTIDDTGEILKQGKIVSKDVVAFGCTSESQARRVAKWHLATSLNETEIINFVTSINAQFLRPGDIINVQDKDNIGIESSGRVAAGSTTNVINLDRVIEEYPGGSASDCVLYLVYPEPGIFLAQDSASINGKSYTRGALLLEDRNGNPISTQEDSINLLDDSANPVVTTYSKNTRVEVKDINGPLSYLNQVTVIGAFSSVPSVDTIWAIGRAQDTTTDEIKEYRVLAISEDKNQQINISASNYYAEKFDEIDIDPPVYTTDYIPISGRLDDVPAPTELNIEMVPEVRSSTFSNATGQKVIISWKAPEEEFTDSAGVTTTIPYRFLSAYEVQHNFTETEGLSGLSSIRVAGTSSSASVSNVSEGFYTVRIRTINDIGVKSPWLLVRRFVSLSSAGNLRINSIAVGGVLTGDSFSINEGNGLVSLGGLDYTYITPGGERYSFTNPSVNEIEEDFGALTSNQEAYLYFDASRANNFFNDPWGAIQIYTDTTVRDVNNNLLNRTYIVPVGYTGTGLFAATGTVSTVPGSSKLLGIGTSFTTEFLEGDLIKTSQNSDPDIEVADAEYRTITGIKSDTELTVNTPYLRTLNSGYLHGQDFKPEIARDAILGKIETNVGSPIRYLLELYINGKGLKGDNGQNVGLLATDYSIVYDEKGLNPSFEASPIDTSAIGIETRSTTISAPEYRYTLNGTAVTSPEFTTNPSYLYAVPSTWSQGADVIAVQVRNIGDTIVALEDALSIVRVKQGSGNLAGVLTNPNQTINTDRGGRTTETNFINASGQWEVFYSGQNVTNSSTYSIIGGTSSAGDNYKTQNGLRLQVDESTGEYDLFQLDPPSVYNLVATIGSGTATGYSVTPSSTSIKGGGTISFSVQGAASSSVYLQFVHVTTADADFTSTPPSPSARETIVLNGGGSGSSSTYTATIDFNTASETFYVEIYDSASGGNKLATSSTITITKQTFNFSVSSNNPTEGDTLTIHLETDNLNVSSLWLSFDSPSAGLGSSDFSNPNFGTNAPIDGITGRTQVTLTSGQADYTIDIASDAADDGETFVPAIYGASSGGSSLSNLGTVTIAETASASGTAQIATTSYFATEEATQAGVNYTASITLNFLRSGDLSRTVIGFCNDFPDTDDWLPVADRASDIGDLYEIKWVLDSGDTPFASWAQNTWASLQYTRQIGSSIVGSRYEPDGRSSQVTISIRKAGAGSNDCSVSVSLSSFVSP